MPAPLRVKLSRLEEETLGELQKANSVSYRIRDRAHMLKLNAQGINVPAIAQIFNCHEHTVRATIKRWSKRGLVGLWEAKGRGAKPKWTEEDLEYIETCLEDEQRTYNSVQLARKLQGERAVNLSSDRLRRILKKKDIVGKEPDRATKKSRTSN
jgi:transposase